MNDRERLIELLGKAEIREDIFSSYGKLLGFSAIKMVYPDCADLLADYLIANGVTVHSVPSAVQLWTVKPMADWTVEQIIDRLAWWARNCGDGCPAAEAMEQAVKRLERCQRCGGCDDRDAEKLRNKNPQNGGTIIL